MANLMNLRGGALGIPNPPEVEAAAQLLEIVTLGAAGVAGAALALQLWRQTLLRSRAASGSATGGTNSSCVGSPRSRIRRGAVGTRAAVRSVLGRAVGRHLSLIGLLLALAPPAGAKQKAPVHPRRAADVAPAPWSRSSGFPPPPLDPIKGTSEGLGDVVREHQVGSRESDPSEHGGERAHPAIHGHRRAPIPGKRLFPRADVSTRTFGSRSQRSTTPAGAGAPTHTRGRVAATPECTHTVVPGESLWSISEAALGAHDVATIAAFWPELYEKNRETVGPEPDLIFPGQVLKIPGQCDD